MFYSPEKISKPTVSRMVAFSTKQGNLRQRVLHDVPFAQKERQRTNYSAQNT